MKIKFKLSIIAMSLVMTNFISADYMAKIPLEVNNGGNLPNNSIIIGNNIVGGSGPIIPNDPIEGAEGETEETPLLPHNPEDCIYDKDNWSYYETDIYGRKYATYNGNPIFFPVAKGALVYDDGESKRYEICYTSPEVGTVVEIIETELDNSYVCGNPTYSQSEVDAIELYLNKPAKDESDPDFNNPLFDNNDDNPFTGTNTYDSYDGSGEVDVYCSTALELRNLIMQNTKTLEYTYDNDGSSLINLIVPSVKQESFNCYYQNYIAGPGTGSSKWLKNNNISSYYYTDSEPTYLDNPTSDIDTTQALTGGANKVKGKYMETIGGIQHHAVCQFGGW